MGAVFGALSAVSIGLTDLFGRHVVNRRGSLVAAMIIQAVATVASGGALLVIASQFGVRDLLIGGVSGVGLGIGLACYLTGLQHSSSAVVAPVVATMSAVIPFAYAVTRGSAASPWSFIGAAVAIGGLLLITAGGGPVRDVQAGLRWAVASGLGYGFGLSVAIEASAESGAWPAVAQRAVAFVLMAVLVGRAHGAVPIVGVRAFGIAAGVFAAASTVFFLLGVQADATPAVVTASMFPAATVTIGALVFGDRVNRTQVAGVGVVLVGVAAVVAA
ncbi:MAG: EamA family transporter [Ilumatobacteraceae bacterium]